jgi:carbamoyl-phosphate synthase small subunit
VISVPWDYDLFSPTCGFAFDGIVVSNGPGNPKMAKQTIQTLRTALEYQVPTLGICLGHQLLALAAGGDTYKLKFGHRSQNQPCLLQGTKRCYITTQNHSFAVGTLPPEFSPWFINANDGSNEGIQHIRLPFLSVQFHPEAAPGPTDTEWVFDYFLKKVNKLA